MRVGKKYQKYRILALVGILGVLCYFLHVLLGQASYPGYRAATQAVSELTAVGAPSRLVATVFSALYGLCMVAFSLGIWTLFRDRISSFFSLGCLLLLGRHLVSFFGYLLFPLAQSGYMGRWKEVAHLMVTGVVLILSLAALLLIGLGSWKKYRGLSIVSFAGVFFLAAGALLTQLVSPSFVGYAQRISAFSLIFYMGLLALWVMLYRPRTINWY